MKVTHGTQVTSEVDAECGIQQGLSDSGWYYVSAGDVQTEGIVASWKRRQLGVWMLEETVTHVAFVDDVLLISDHFENVQVCRKQP